MSLNAGGASRTKRTGFMGTKVLFDANSITDTSPVAQIDDEPIIVRAHGLGVGERVYVEMVDGEGEGTHFSPYMVGGRRVYLTRKCNLIVMAIPGRYRFILDGVLGGAYVNYFSASMTHEYLIGAQKMGGCCDEFPSSLPPNGPAGGDLTGEYPNPEIDGLKAIARVIGDANAKTLLEQLVESLFPAIPTALPPSGNAGGMLTGQYPSPDVDVLKVAEAIGKNQQAQQILADALCAALACCINDATKQWQRTDDEIAGVFKRCDGSKHVAGNPLPTCSEVDDKIAQAIGGITTDKFLDVVQYDPVTHTLTLQVTGGDTFTVNLSDLIPIVTGLGLSGDGTVGTPAQIKLVQDGGLSVTNDGLSVAVVAAVEPARGNGNNELPVTVYGGRGALLGTPDGWMTFGGKRIPFWN